MKAKRKETANKGENTPARKPDKYGVVRTQEEIVKGINEREDIAPMMGFIIIEDLIPYLDYDHAKQFLNDDVTPEQFEREIIKELRIPVRDQMIKYMPFAWEKANNKRGLSAYRTMVHYSTWLWLIGEDRLSEKCHNYEYYGKPQLVEICRYLGLDPNVYDDGVRENA